MADAALHRFWFKFEGDVDSRLGYGVTAWTEDDAIAILRDQIFRDRPLPKAVVTADVDVSILDAGHIRPNMESPSVRGIWFPRGLSDTRLHDG